MIKNYIFDFGNVLANFYPEEFTSAFIDDAEHVKQVSQVVFDRTYWDKLDDGTITDLEVKDGIKQRLPENLQETACKIYDSWIQLLTPVKGMEKLVNDIKNQGGKLYLISNISIGFAENYHKNSWIEKLFSLFDGLVLSGPLGITKPERKIFDYLLDKYSLNPEECIFIDDSEKNIKGCEITGIKGYLFDGDADKLRKALKIFI